MSATPAGGAHWTAIPERGSFLLMRVMAWLSLCLGRRVSRLLLHAIAAYFVLFSPASRRASRSYLTRVLGRTPAWRDIYRHFFTFATTVHDRVFFVSKRFEQFEMTAHGSEVLQAAIDAGQGLFFIGAHLGSFESLHAIAALHGRLRAVMVMHEENARKINQLLRTINPQASADIVPLGKVDSMLQLSQRLAEGNAIGMLADRSPVPDTLQRVQILGADAWLPSGPFRVAALLRRPVFFMAGLYAGDNRYTVYFEPLADFSTVPAGHTRGAVETAIHRYAALLDQYCRKAPYNWFNFYDFWQPAEQAKRRRQ